MSAARLLEWPIRSISSRRLAPASATSWLPAWRRSWRWISVSSRDERGSRSAPELAVPQRLAARAGEHQRVGSGGVKVSRWSGLGQISGQDDRALTGAVLGGARTADVRPSVSCRAMRTVRGRIDVAAAEPGQLAPAQTAEAGEQDHAR